MKPATIAQRHNKQFGKTRFECVLTDPDLPKFTKKQKQWRRLDADGVKLFKEMLIMFTPKVNNPESKIWRILKEDCVVLIRKNTLNGNFDCRVSFNKEEEDYEMTHVDAVHQAQKALKKWGYTQHPVFAVKTMTDLWKLYSKEVK